MSRAEVHAAVARAAGIGEARAAAALAEVARLVLADRGGAPRRQRAGASIATDDTLAAFLAGTERPPWWPAPGEGAPR